LREKDLNKKLELKVKVSNKFSDVDNIKFNKYCCFKKNCSIKLFLFILATQFLWRSFCQLIVDVGRGILWGFERSFDPWLGQTIPRHPSMRSWKPSSAWGWWTCRACHSPPSPERGFPCHFSTNVQTNNEMAIFSHQQMTFTRICTVAKLTWQLWVLSIL